MNPRGTPRGADIPQITALEAQRKHAQGAVILDVRELDEWTEGHIAGALFIPLGTLTARVGELDPASDIVVVCHSGIRSMAAAKFLAASGFARVSNLDGGMVAWERQGLAIAH